MKAMLPEWEGITLKRGGMNAHDALSEINSVVHCVSKAEIENGGLCYPRSTYGFDFMEVCTFLVQSALLGWFWGQSSASSLRN